MKKFYFLLVAVFAMSSFGFATDCEITKVNGGGFTTTIQSVIQNCDNTYTITLRVEHNGCGGPTCKDLSHYSVQAAPGTYSNISVNVISGGMTYGSLEMGPNLGGDPFQGFKLDNTRGIGGGKAGIFTITYTIAGNLQSQKASAKAGTSGQIVTFSAQDFECVMNCAETTCEETETDTDGDGCEDEYDAYPNDPNLCLDNYFPANEFGTLAYEDLWPATGDFDFNDLVIDYRFSMPSNAQNYVSQMTATFVIRAFGASYHNGFGFQFMGNINPNHISVTGSSLTENIITLLPNGLEAGQAKPTIIVYDDAYAQMAHPGSGIGVNTTPDAPYVQPVTITLTINLQPNTYTVSDLSIANFNPFIFVDQIRGKEVHLPNYAPTSLVDVNYFGNYDDTSVPAQGRYYKTATNLPWAINIYESFEYPKEKQPVTSAYLKFVEWVTSGGVLYPDWYKDLPGYRNDSFIY